MPRPCRVVDRDPSTTNGASGRGQPGVWGLVGPRGRPQVPSPRPLAAFRPAVHRSLLCINCWLLPTAAVNSASPVPPPQNKVLSQTSSLGSLRRPFPFHIVQKHLARHRIKASSVRKGLRCVGCVVAGLVTRETCSSRFSLHTPPGPPSPSPDPPPPCRARRIARATSPHWERRISRTRRCRHRARAMLCRRPVNFAHRQKMAVAPN